VAFVAPASAGPGGGGVYRFELMLVPGGPGSTLILRQSIYRRPQPRAVQAVSEPPPMGMERSLHGGIDRLAMQYYGAPAPDQPAAWQDRWTGGDRLPDLVAITFTTGTGPERMVVPLRLAGTR
jgi:hypothetical protein